jgi:hypothetical protein
MHVRSRLRAARGSDGDRSAFAVLFVHAHRLLETLPARRREQLVPLATLLREHREGPPLNWRRLVRASRERADRSG